MSVKQVFALSRSAGLLPYAGIALLVVAMLAGAGGTWFGYRWHKGATAIAQNAQLRKDVKAWEDIAERQFQINVDTALAMHQAAGRMDAIAHQRELDREEIRTFFEGQSQALQNLLRHRPDLQRQLGDDVLGHLNRAKAGPGANPAAAVPGCKPDAAVPGAAVPGRQQRGGADRGRRQHGPAVPRLPGWHEQPDQRGEGVGEDRMAVVLRRGETGRAAGRGMPGREVK